nr:ribonuclease H-like domain-containing protein [Tanacetum cinerariifolium]
MPRLCLKAYKQDSVRNKADFNTMSIDDLYNNFKIVKQEVKRTVTSSSSLGSQKMAFLSSLGSTNEVDTSSIQVGTISTPVSTVSSHDNTANLSDATIYAFLANQPNGSQLVHEDLEQIHEDDLKEIDLKWQLALLSMRARRLNVEDTSSKAMVAIDGAGFNWSYMADDEVPTNMALMAFSDSEAQNSKTCSNTCLKSFETLKTQYDNLRIEFNKSEFDLATYKRDKAQKRLEVKARSTLMMGIPNEHQLNFNSIKDAKQLMEAIEKRFGKNAATKKTQRNLLKQLHENFTASNSEMLDQTFDRLQKLNTHAVVWRNKADLDTMSLDDLYKNLKSDQAEEGLNYTLMAFTSTSSDSKVSIDSTCKKSCLAAVKILKSQNEQLIKDLKKSVLMVLGYKSGLESVKERLKFFKTNKSVYLEDIKLLKVKIQMKETTIIELNRKLDVAQKEKDDEFADKPVAENIKYSKEETKAIMKKLMDDVLLLEVTPKEGKSLAKKGKQHKASCKTKIENSISLLLHLLHMDLFGPTFIQSLMKKMYCLVVIDDYSSQYKDAKTLFEAIQARFSGNDAAKKTQRTLLKQMYKRFNASSIESLNSIFNQIWKIRNKVDFNTMSIDDLYNNFKIVEQEVKRTVPSSSSLGSQKMAFLSSLGSTNEVDTSSIQVSTISTPVSTVSSHDNTGNLSDATIYAFLANQPNGSQLVHEDLEQIYEDDPKEMDLKWQLALLSMRARSDEDESEEMVLKSNNVQHKPEQANQPRKGAPQDALKDQGYSHSRCFRHMIGNTTSLILKSMIEGMLPLGEELKVVRLLEKAQSEVVSLILKMCAL